MKQSLLISMQALILFSGCSLLGPSSDDNRVIERSGMKVSVYSGGKKLTNPEKELVHRISVPEADFDKCQQIFSAADKWMKPELDSSDESSGLRVTGSNAVQFGLFRGDLLMSMNKTHTTKLSDVSGFCSSLITSKTVTMSVVRESETHEIYLAAK